MAERNRRQEIMQAAEGLFTSRRFHEITLDDVAHRASVGKGTIYRYFKDKDDLFLQTAMSGFDELCELLKKPATDQAPFARQLLCVSRRISEFFRNRRPLFRMMQSEESRMHWCKGELRRHWFEHRKSLAAAVAGVLRRGVSEGAVRGDIAPELLASVLLSILRTYARDLSQSPHQSHSLKTLVDLFLQGAAAPAAAAVAAACQLAATERTRGGSR